MDLVRNLMLSSLALFKPILGTIDVPRVLTLDRPVAPDQQCLAHMCQRVLCSNRPRVGNCSAHDYLYGLKGSL